MKHIKGRLGPELFEVVEKTVPEPDDGEFLVKQAYMSMDGLNLFLSGGNKGKLMVEI